MNCNALNATNIKLNEFATVFRYLLDVRKITGTPNATVSTPYFMLNGVEFKVQFENLQNQFYVALYTDKTVEVEASFKLFKSPDSAENTLTKLISKTSINPLVAIKNFVTISDLVKSYSYKNFSTFEIDVKTYPVPLVIEKPAKELEVMTKTILFEITNLNQLSANVSNITLRNVVWNIRTQKINDTFSILFEVRKNTLSMYSFEVDVSVILIPFQSSTDPIKRTFTHVYRWDSAVQEVVFANWDDLFNPEKKYVLDNKANILVEIKAKGPRKHLLERFLRNYFIDRDSPL